jgi:hypothetical protein
MTVRRTTMAKAASVAVQCSALTSVRWKDASVMIIKGRGFVGSDTLEKHQDTPKKC